MKIATFEFDGVQSWGLVSVNPNDGEEWVYEPWKLEDAFDALAYNGTNGYFRCRPEFWPDNAWPRTVKEFLTEGDIAMDRLKKLEIFLERYIEQSDPYFVSCVGHKLSDVRLRVPVPDSKLFLGLVQNSPSFFRARPERHHVNVLPQGHQRAMTSVVGSGETYNGVPAGNVELGIVIGKKCYNVPIEKAYDYVAGYVVVYDSQGNSYYEEYEPELFDVKDDYRENVKLLSKYPDWYLDATTSWMGKGADGRAICGPYITTKDEIGNPYDLDVVTLINGVNRDHSSTAGYLIGVERTVSFFSSFMTLNPGDIIHLGTVGTDGIAFDRKQMSMKNGGTAGAWIEKCGTIEAQVYAPNPYEFGEDTRTEEQKKIPLVPAAEDFIRMGKTEVDRFDTENVKCMWTCFGNFDTVEDVYGWKKTELTSRVLNGPAGQITDKVGTDLHVAPIAGELEIACEIGFVIGKQGKGITKENAAEHILGIAPIISVCDMSIKNKIIEPATLQESNIGLDYGRWGDGYQTIGEVKDVPLKGRRMVLTVGDTTIECNTDEYVVGVERTLEYISHATTMLAGDVITLGRLGKTVRLPEGSYKNGVKITLKVDGFDEISRTVYPFAE